VSAIKAAFDTYFAHWGITLPERALETRASGVLRAAGWHIRYRFGQEGGRDYLDFYATHRMTNDRHVRIDSDGQVTHLEAMLDFFSYDPNVPGDKERAEREYTAHNRRVARLIAEKWPEENSPAAGG